MKNETMRNLYRWVAAIAALPIATAIAQEPEDHDSIMETKSYLGVYVEPVPDALSAQLGLEPEVGVVVKHVVEESPAEAAGIKMHDILLKYDDQMLIGTKQIVVLVRNSEIGSTHSVTYLRGGKESTLSVEIGSKKVMPMKEGKPKDKHGMLMPPPLQPGNAPMPPNAVSKTIRILSNDSEQGENVMFFSTDEDVDFSTRMERSEEFDTIVNTVRLASQNPMGVAMPTFVFHGENRVFEFKDESGNRYVITEKDGKRDLIILDDEGKETFAGALDAEAEGKLPESVRNNLPELEKIVRVERPRIWTQERSDTSF